MVELHSRVRGVFPRVLASKGNSVGQQQLWKKSEECLFHNFKPSQNRHAAGQLHAAQVSKVELGLPTVLDKNVFVFEAKRTCVGESNIVVNLIRNGNGTIYNPTSEG